MPVKRRARKTPGTVGIGTWPQPERSIRIRLPADVAFNIGKLNKVFRNVAQELGHPACFSGVNCLFEMETSFVVNKRTLKLESFSGGVIING